MQLQTARHEILSTAKNHPIVAVETRIFDCGLEFKPCSEGV